MSQEMDWETTVLCSVSSIHPQSYPSSSLVPPQWNSLHVPSSSTLRTSHRSRPGSRPRHFLNHPKAEESLLRMIRRTECRSRAQHSALLYFDPGGIKTGAPEPHSPQMIQCRFSSTLLTSAAALRRTILFPPEMRCKDSPTAQQNEKHQYCKGFQPCF